MLSRTIPLVLFLASAAVQPAQAAGSSLRATTVDNNSTLSIARARSLQAAESFGNDTIVTLSADGALLNELIQLVLPLINAGIQAFTPDPLNLDIAGVLEIGSFNFGCGDTGLDFTYNWGGLSGLSNFFIDTLSIVPGTEQVAAGAGRSDWSGTFSMAIASASSFTVDDLGAGFNARACGLAWDETIGGTLVTAQPFMGGAVELAGSICNGALDINTASIIENLAVGYSSVTAQLTGAPPVVNSFLGSASSQMSTMLEADLVNTMEPEIRPIIEQQLAGQETIWAPLTIFPINAKFVRNAAVRRIEGAYSNTIQFLGLGDADDNEGV